MCTMPRRWKKQDARPRDPCVRGRQLKNTSACTHEDELGLQVRPSTPVSAIMLSGATAHVKPATSKMPGVEMALVMFWQTLSNVPT